MASSAGKDIVAPGTGTGFVAGATVKILQGGSGPTAIPASFADPFGIEPSELARAASRVGRLAGK